MSISRSVRKHLSLGEARYDVLQDPWGDETRVSGREFGSWLESIRDWETEVIGGPRSLQLELVSVSRHRDSPHLHLEADLDESQEERFGAAFRGDADYEDWMTGKGKHRIRVRKGVVSLPAFGESFLPTQMRYHITDTLHDSRDEVVWRPKNARAPGGDWIRDPESPFESDL